MDAVILAIKPMYAERILVGRKRFEYRRKCRCIRGGTVVLMYATAPVQAIVGHFTAGEVIRGNPPDVWRQSFHGAGIERPHYEEYFAGAAEACAIGAMEPVRWPRATPMHEVPCRRLPRRPPQSLATVELEAADLARLAGSEG